MSSSDDPERQRADGHCAFLKSLGIDARVLEREPSVLEQGPFTSEPTDRTVWIEIAAGPIRWASYSDSGDSYYVPDPRMGPNLPYFNFVVVPTLVRWVPLFGPIKRLRWELRSFAPSNRLPLYTAFSISLSNRLNQDPGLGPRILFDVYVTSEMNASKKIRQLSSAVTLGIHVRFRIAGGWALSQDLDTDAYEGFLYWDDRPLWACCQAVAQHLLATPITKAMK